MIIYIYIYIYVHTNKQIAIHYTTSDGSWSRSAVVSVKLRCSLMLLYFMVDIFFVSFFLPPNARGRGSDYVRRLLEQVGTP